MAEPEQRTTEALYRTHHERMVRLAHVLVGSNPVAEELVHDAFVELHRREGRIDNPAGYLRMVVVNKCRSHLRHLAVERRTVVEPARRFLPPELDETWTALRVLPERRRTAVVLRFYEDLPDEEIARILGCRPATVRTMIFRALATLREVLES